MWNSKAVSPKVCFPVVVPSYFVSFVQRFLHIVSLAPLIRKMGSDTDDKIFRVCT